jgi:hypothetical protein
MPQQIGMSTEAKLLYQIKQKIRRLTQVVGSSITTTTTTTAP